MRKHRKYMALGKNIIQEKGSVQYKPVIDLPAIGNENVRDLLY